MPVKDLDAPRLWLPLLDGVERLGVLDVTLPAGTDPDDPTLHGALRSVAGLLGHLVHVKSPYGDAVHRVRGQRSRTVAAELLWQLLPPLTFGNDRVVVSGVLQPSYDVGGDAFDHAADPDRVHLAAFDVMGHSLNAGLIAAVALAAYRNCSPTGPPLRRASSPRRDHHQDRPMVSHEEAAAGTTPGAANRTLVTDQVPETGGHALMVLIGALISPTGCYALSRPWRPRCARARPPAERFTEGGAAPVAGPSPRSAFTCRGRWCPARRRAG